MTHDDLRDRPPSQRVQDFRPLQHGQHLPGFGLREITLQAAVMDASLNSGFLPPSNPWGRPAGRMMASILENRIVASIANLNARSAFQADVSRDGFVISESRP